MKLIHTLTTLSTLTVLNLTSLTYGGTDCNKCEKSTCQTKTCDKKSDAKDCEKCDSANAVDLVVTGMTCGGCSGKVTKALKAVEGVTTKKVCHKSGSVQFTIDPSKTDKTKVIAAINATGFKVAGEKLNIPITGMTCGGCSKKVATALESLEGCTLGKVCHKSGHAEVTIDPAKTSKQKVIEAINATGFKAQTPKSASTPAPAEKKES